MLLRPSRNILIILLFAVMVLQATGSFAVGANDNVPIDRIQLVKEQIGILKNRYKQVNKELTELQQEHENEISQLALEKASKNLIDKASLDISVGKSNLDSISIELTDVRLTISWLEKNIQEIENQINVVGIFGLKIAHSEHINLEELSGDLIYQKNLLALEKKRLSYLQNLQSDAANILQFKKDKLLRLTAILKSNRLVHMRQMQVRDELLYQQQQNNWLQQLNTLYQQLGKLDPLKDKTKYGETERRIFYANENANYAYSQSLIARYKDQIQQMRSVVVKSTSLTLLHEINDQVSTLTKQIERLDKVQKNRIAVLNNHIKYLSLKKKNQDILQPYIANLTVLKKKYETSDLILTKINASLSSFRSNLDRALQSELSARQGLPTFSIKMLLDLGKEILLVPALTFQALKSLSTNLLRAFENTSMLKWSIFLGLETLLLAGYLFIRKILFLIPDQGMWLEKINTKWLILQCIRNNFADLFIIGNLVAALIFFNIPLSNFIFFCYLSLVWLIFKTILVISRIALVETTHDSTGHDVRLYKRLKWVIIVAGIVTAMTVFVHQLPLIYELKTLCERLFLFCLLMCSIFLLRSWEVVPKLILSHMESSHLYFEKVVRLLGLVIPILLLCNSLVGLIGFVNLVKTISWYEGIFLIVMIGYIIVRGLLSDVMEMFSRVVIQYTNNGWLWTEAFIKPIDKVLRITLFLVAGGVLFILYGWDKQSPIVERLVRLVHYPLMKVVGTEITPLAMIELFVMVSVFYWTAKWIREFVYRLLSSRTKDMGVRNSIAMLSQYGVIVLGICIGLKFFGIDTTALAAILSLFALGIGLGLRDLANNFACGFLILLERPLRVGDIVSINNCEGEVTHIGSRAVTVRTWDNTETLVPNAEIFNKSFTNWTSRDSIIRGITIIKISRYDNPHEVKKIIMGVLSENKNILSEPVPDVYIKEMTDTLVELELRFYVNIRQVKSRSAVMSEVLMAIWDSFTKHGIKTPYPQQEIFIRNSEQSGLRLPGPMQN